MIFGIDVSSNNHTAPIDWALVAKAGVQFVCLKATEGADYTNPFYATDRDIIRAAGLELLHYHFDRADLGINALNEVNNFLTVVGQPRLGEPLAIDVEKPGDGLQNRITFEVNTIQQARGIRPLVYTRRNFAFDNQLNDNADLGQCGLWLAEYETAKFPDAISGWPFVAIWQFGQGPVPGIEGDVDFNLFNGTRQQFRAYGRAA